MHYLTEKEYDVFVRRADQYMADGLPGCDARIVETVKRLNRLEGLVVIWSCSGHTLEEMGDDVKRTDKRQIILGIRPSGFHWLAKISDYMTHMPTDKYHKHWLELHATMLNWAYEDNIDFNYKAWSLEMKFFTRVEGSHEDMMRYWAEMLNHITM